MDNNDELQIVDDDEIVTALVENNLNTIEANMAAGSANLPEIGRKAVFNPRTNLKMIKSFALLGYSDEMIADALGVTFETFTNWVLSHNEIQEALSEGRGKADAIVASALFRSAVGYETTEVIKELVNGELTVTRTLTKQVAPNGRDARQWLSIRQPEIWRESLQAEDLDGSLTKFFDNQQLRIAQGDK